MEMYSRGWRVRIRNPIGAARRAGVQIPPSPPMKKRFFGISFFIQSKEGLNPRGRERGESDTSDVWFSERSEVFSEHRRRQPGRMAQPDEQAVKSLQLKHCIFLLSCLKNTTFSQYHILQTRVKYPFYVLFFEFEYKIQYNFENSLYFPDKLETFYNIQRFEHVNVPVYQCKYCRISIFFYISTCFTYSYIRAV